MILKEAGFRPYLLTVLVLLILIAGRSVLALGDFSYFFVAGTDFVDKNETPAPVWVQDGQGYDGQFFYRLALDPFDFSKTKFGVTIDHIAYRAQRIVYPLLCWIFSFGGIASLVPVAMVAVNVCAFLGIIYFIGLCISKTKSHTSLKYFPLLLCGLYMSLARDLSEVTELFFFTAAIYFLFSRQLLKFAVFATCTLLTRETSIVVMIPVIGIFIYYNLKNVNGKKLLLLIIPLIFLICWKAVVAIFSNEPGFTGSGNFTWPFAGMIQGLSGNLNTSNPKNILQLVFWIAYLSWQILFAGIVIKSIFNVHDNGNKALIKSLSGAYLTWLLFALFFSAAIYVDDWSFVRVFSLWNSIGFLILIFIKHPVPMAFRYYSYILVTLTIVRLIIRP